jgi:DNA repair protein RadC
MSRTPIGVRELAIRYKPLRVALPVNGDVGTPLAAAHLAAAVLAGLTVEQVIALHVNTKQKLIGVHVVSIGTLNASLVHPREVFKAALLTNAAGLILAHNHPSGDPTPSPEDRALVSRLRQAGDILGVELLDALIVTDPMDGGAYYSFREAGVL